MTYRFPKLILSTSVILSALVSPALAHDFWLQPEQFTIQAGDAQPADVLIGHPEDKLRWPLAPERLISVQTVGPTRLTDQVQHYKPEKKHLTVRVEEDGYHWLTIATQDSVSELESERFDDYVEDENLIAIKAHRNRLFARDKAGVERYSRRGKALLTVGDVTGAVSDHVTRPVGLTLEIIPLVNPLAIEAGADLPLEVRYRGQPLPGARIKIIRLDETETLDPVDTDATGRATVIRPSDGEWMYHVIWGTPLPKSYDQDYDTIFSSLSFSVD